MLIAVIVLSILTVFLLFVSGALWFASVDLREENQKLHDVADKFLRLRAAAYELVAHDLKTTHTFTDSSGGPYARSREVQKNTAVDRFNEVLRHEIDGQEKRPSLTPEDIGARPLGSPFPHPADADDMFRPL